LREEKSRQNPKIDLAQIEGLAFPKKGHKLKVSIDFLVERIFIFSTL